ncbi:MAG: 2-hydroxyacid dehydrogenase [Pseudomonadota bacterium]
MRRPSTGPDPEGPARRRSPAAPLVTDIGQGEGAQAIPAARQTGFPPVIDAGCETLILGSFPGAASLAAGHYYAHPRNQFWPILEQCLGERLTRLDFGERYRTLLRHRIALWDVIDDCVRPGSLDADIRDARPNEPARVMDAAPRLRRILFNGRTAARHSAFFDRAGVVIHVLPSTSPAHAGMPFARKLEAWSRALSA